MDGHQVGLPQKPIKRNNLHPRLGRCGREVGVGRQDAQAESGHFPHGGARNPAEPHEPQGELADPADREGLRGATPPPGLDLPVVKHNAARTGEQQGHGMVGDLLRAVIRRVGDHDAGPGRRRHVDVVNPNGVLGDHPAPRQSPDHPRRHRRLRSLEEDGIGVGAGGDDLVLGHRFPLDQVDAHGVEPLPLVGVVEIAVDVDGLEAVCHAAKSTGSRG